MDESEQNKLKRAGFQIGDFGDFLGLSTEERRYVELKLALRRAVRAARERQNMTQQQLAARLKSTQSRVAKIEGAAADVSLDLMFRGLFAAGGDLSDLIAPVRRRTRKVTPK